MQDNTNLQRFIDAQELMYDKALSELKSGKKENHWTWYIFPQTYHEGMGSVATRFALDEGEVEAYLAHPVLGSRLIECIKAVLYHTDKSLLDIFGSELDVKKFYACMRLFSDIDDTDIFHKAQSLK